MIAAIQIPGRQLPCVVRWTGRDGLLKASSITWCGAKGNAADGVIQIPDHAKVCSLCETQIKVAYPK